MGATLLGAVLLVVGGAAVIWLGVTGQLADLRHANLPLHPYPPAGYAYNPFNPSNKDDLINLADASAVKTDLLTDGQIQNDALAGGDGSNLGRATTGGALVSLQHLIDSNNQQGIVEKSMVHINAITVGNLADPNSASIHWCVQEVGTGTLTFTRKADGSVVRTQSVRFRSKYWLTKSGDRYLIADSLVTLQ